MATVDKKSSVLGSQIESNHPFATSTSDPNERPKSFQSTVQECLFVLTTTMSFGMFQFLYGITTVVTAPIARALEMSSAEIAWINASFALTSGSFVLVFATIADDFGRRPMLIFSMGAFAISSIVAGFATNALYLNIFGGVLGLWSAAAVSPAAGILGSVYEKPSKRKNMAFACFSAGNPVGFVLGTIFSGIAAQLFGWRASFFLLGIFYALIFVASFWTVPKEQKKRQKLTLGALKRFDVLGALLSTAGIALVCSSLTIVGDAPKGWTTGYVIVLLTLGLFLILSFIAWEGISKHPFMPLHIWQDRNFSLINIIVVLGFMSFATCDFWLALYMQNVLRHSPLSVGVHLLPSAIGGIAMNVVAAFTLHRVDNKIITGIASVALTASAVLLATMEENSSYWAFIFPALLLSVTGADFLFNVANMYVMSSLPSEQQSLAGGIFNAVNKMCVTIGLGVVASIYAAESDGHEALQMGMRPYRMVFWFAVAAAGASLLFVPFLTIGTQGNPVRGASEDDLESRQVLNWEGGERIGLVAPETK